MSSEIADCLATIQPKGPALFALAVMVAALLFLLWMRRATHFYGKRLFVIANLGLAWWLGAAALELAVTPGACKLLFAKFAFPGITLLPTAWVLFVYRYALGQTGQLTKRHVALLVLAPGVVTAMALTNPWHELFYAPGTGPRAQFPDAPIIYRYGPLFYVAAIYMYGCLVAAMGILTLGMVASRRRYRSHFGALLALMILPTLGNVLYITMGVTIADFDPTPFLFSAVLVGYAWLITVNRMFDLSWLARDLIFDKLPDGYLIVARSGEVLGANARAKRDFGIDPTDRIGPNAACDLGPLMAHLGQDPYQEDRIRFEVGRRVFEALPRPIKRPLGLNDPVMGWIVMFTDITERIERQQELEQAVQTATESATMMANLNRQIQIEARTDPLTGLLNRRSLQEDISAILETEVPPEWFITVAAIDLDHFKSVNDRFGHDAGDTVLVAFANRLRSSFREKDRVYRLGGEEFMVIAEGLSKVEAAARLDALRDSTRTMPEIDGMPELQVRFSAGLARWPEDDPHLENVLRMADDRLYGAKNAGRSQTRSE